MPARLPSAFCATLLTSLILTACSEKPAGSETEAEKFRQMQVVLPTASTADTARTREEVGRFRVLFFALCPTTVCALSAQAPD